MLTTCHSTWAHCTLPGLPSPSGGPGPGFVTEANKVAGVMREEPPQEHPPFPAQACALPTNVSPGQEGDQLLPLKHLLLVLKVSEAFGGAAHQLKACDTRRWLSCRPPATRPPCSTQPGLHRAGTEASLPGASPVRTQRSRVVGRGQDWQTEGGAGCSPGRSWFSRRRSRNPSRWVKL